MTATPNTLRMAEQALAAHKAQLATTSNKDQVRRQIAAAQARVDQIRRDLAA